MTTGQAWAALAGFLATAAAGVWIVRRYERGWT